MSISPVIHRRNDGPLSPPVGLQFFDKEAEKLWVETHVPKLVRAIRRSALVRGEGQIARSPMPPGIVIAGGETSFGMFFLARLPIDLELRMTPELKEIRRIVSGLDSVFRNSARVSRLSYLFDELLHSPISQIVSSPEKWLVSRRRVVDASLLDGLVEAAREYGKSAETSLNCKDSSDPPANGQAHECVPTGERVVLRGRTESAIVLGRDKRKLTKSQYDVVKALLDAGDEGLSKDELVENSRHGDAVNVLKRLSNKDPDWEKVIHLAGITGGGYHIK